MQFDWLRAVAFQVELDAHLAKFVVVSALLDDIQNALTR